MPRDGALAWLATAGRLYAGASAIALVQLVASFPDFPLEMPGAGGRVLMLVVAAVATFGALWRAPAKWIFFAAPLALLALSYALARVAVLAPAALLGLGRPPVELVNANLVPIGFLMLPAVLVGTVAAAASLER